MSLRDEVVVNGVTLYAPMFACRPVDVAEWPAARRQLWRELIAETGIEPTIYPGSTFLPCEACGIQVAVGPRQQEAAEVALEVGLNAHVYCMLCSVEQNPGVTAMHLGNPFQRRL